jgi:hypothetical protein
VNPVARYLVGAFELAAFCYSMNRAAWPDKGGPAAGIPQAVLLGLIIQGIATRREQSRNQPPEPYPKSFYLFAILVGLSACVAYWAGATLAPGRAQLVSGIGFGVCLLAVAVVVVRRRRAQAAAQTVV